MWKYAFFTYFIQSIIGRHCPISLDSLIKYFSIHEYDNFIITVWKIATISKVLSGKTLFI